MTYMVARRPRIGFVGLMAAILTAAFSSNSVAKAHKGHRQIQESRYESAQRVSHPPALHVPMRHYGGPKSPMWR